MRRPRRLGSHQKPSPQDRSPFSDRLLAAEIGVASGLQAESCCSIVSTQMKRIILLLGMAGWLASALGAEPTGKFFPYSWSYEALPNGLRVVTVPTDDPNLVALYLVVRTGSRNEVEAGKSGYAHLFEHMMFRGSEHFTAEQRDNILKKAGAHNNAYTTDDRTVYHVLFSKSDLEQVMELEADRFMRLKYSKDLYKTETRAVLGEYNKNFSAPGNKLDEVLRSTAYSVHTYHHGTMGFIEDIEDMPNQYDYSWVFYRRYYRPENTTILLVGDVKPEQSLALVKKYFGAWERGDYRPEIKPEPPQEAPRGTHVDWTSPTLPLVTVAYRAPAYSDEGVEKAALDLLLPIAFGENSELYQKLVLREQKVEVLAAGCDDHVDAELFSVSARVKDRKDLEYVRDQIIATFDRFAKEPVPQAQLTMTRARARYGTALGWNSANSIAGFLAPYLGLRETPETIEKLFKLYDRISAEEIQAAAKKYFSPNNRTVVTLATKPETK